MIGPRIIRQVKIPNTTKESLINEVRDMAKQVGQDNMSGMLKLVLRQLGHEQADTSKSGYHFLQVVLNDCFVDGLPGPIYLGDPSLQKLDTHDYFQWNTNIDLIRGVKQAILWAKSAVGLA